MAHLPNHTLAPREAVRERLRALLCCPACASRRLEYNADRLTCGACKLTWPLLDGEIPYFAQSFVDIDPALRREIQCQNNALQVYENPKTLSYHWDRETMPAMGQLFEARQGTVLDFGCGVGYFAQHFPRYDVVGIDVSPVLLRQAKTRAGLVVGADARALPFEAGSFDLLFARGVLHHLVDPVKALAEMFRVLKPGGEAVFHDPRAFRTLEFVKRNMRRKSDLFAETHTAFPRHRYREMLEGAGFRIDRFEDWDPVGLLLLSLGDELRMGRLGNPDRIARACLALDRGFDRLARPIPALRRFGFIMVAHARKP